MKTIGWALAAILAVSTAPSFAYAQAAAQPRSPGQNTTSGADIDRDQDSKRESRGARRGRGKAAAAAPDGAAARAKGMAEAPALVTAAGLQCTMTDARSIGTGKSKDASGAEVTSNLYEVACAEGLGYMLVASGTAKPEAFDCLVTKVDADRKTAAGEANPLRCTLPANADPARSLQPLVAKVQPACQVGQARYVGSNNRQGVTMFEIGCASTPGFILSTPQAGSTATLSAMSCLKAGAGGIACEYTPKTSQVASLNTLIAPAGKACAVSDARWVTDDPAKNSTYYEVACGEGKAGFMVEANAAGGLVRALECTRATGIAGGCTLTDAVTAQTEEASVYKALAQKGGFPCDVGAYRLLGMEGATKREVVELQCKERPEGVIAFFPAATGGKADFYDCSKVSYRKLNCSLTKPEATFPRLTRELQGKGKTCQVTGVRGVGLIQETKTEFVEVSCATGPGFMLEYTAGPAFSAPKSVLTCAEAAGIGAADGSKGCTLGKTAAAGTTRR